MSHEQPTIPDAGAERNPSSGAAAEQSPSSAAIADVPGPAREPEWEEPLELAPRPRRRLLAPLPLALLGVLLIACGFIGGVLVEKGQTSSSPAAAGASSGLAARLAGLRGGGAGAGARSGEGSSAAGSSAAASSGLGGGGGARPTAGQVAYLSGSTLYVTDAEGNTVKVTTSPATSVSKTVEATVKGIHPGETVTVVGAASASGAVAAETIRVGAAGLAGLFGGGGAGAGSAGAGGGSGAGTAGAAPQLFGPGG
jgi:hypothetical protein